MIINRITTLQFFSTCLLLIIEISGIMIKKQCPRDEKHKSCSFVEEYTCWTSELRDERFKTTPKRLSHCISGCLCKKDFVREFPNGGCIVAAGCRNQDIREMLSKLPIEEERFFTAPHKEWYYLSGGVR